MIEHHRFVSQPMPWTTVLALAFVCAAPPMIILVICLATLFFNL
jgi:hypothetical protein